MGWHNYLRHKLQPPINHKDSFQTAAQRWPHYYSLWQPQLELDFQSAWSRTWHIWQLRRRAPHKIQSRHLDLATFGCYPEYDLGIGRARSHRNPRLDLLNERPFHELLFCEHAGRLRDGTGYEERVTKEKNSPDPQKTF